MNKLFLLLVIQILTFSDLKSQDIGIGTKWVYNQNWFSPWPTNEDVRTLEITSDTLINNKLYYLLTGSCECSNSVNLSLRWENNQVLQYLNNTESVLYDFNLTAGDSLKVDFLTPDAILSTQVIVDSIGTNNGYKLQHISISESQEQYTDWYGVFVEKFGSINWCLTPQMPLCENTTGGLCEIITASNDTIRFVDIYNCIISSTFDIEEQGFYIQPNPTSTYWEIPSTFAIEEYYVLNIQGQVLLHQQVYQNRDFLIDASQFNSGVYILAAKDENDNTYSFRLIKE